MKSTYLTAAALTGLLAVAAGPASAAIVNVTFSGPGVSGALVLTYGAATDAYYPNAYEVTGISGTFSDSNNGLNIVNAPVGPLVPITRESPNADNHLAPKDFSRFAVASGLTFGVLSYDNLFWPGGSPQTASDYDPHGGFLDIYGLLFEIADDRVVNFWSNGVSGAGDDYYGIAVATAAQALDYVDGGVSATAVLPEPASIWLLAGGMLGLLFRRRRSASA